MPAERRQVLSRLNSPSNGASVRPSRRRTAALPSANPSVDLGHSRSSTRSSAEFARGLDDALNPAGNFPPSDTPANHTHHRSRPSLSRASRPQSVYQIVEAYRPLAYSIEKAEQEAKAAEKRRSLLPSPLVTTTTTIPTETQMAPQPVPLAVADDDDAMLVDEFGSFDSPPAVPTPSNYHTNEDYDDFAVLRSPTRGKKQEECISGRGMLKRGYHIILDTTHEGSEEARWAAIKRMEAQLRELDKSFTRVAPPSRRRFTSLTNHASTAATAAAPPPCSFSTTASRAAWNI